MIAILKIRLNESSITFIKQLPTVGWFADSAFSRFAHSSLSPIPHVKQQLLLRKNDHYFHQEWINRNCFQNGSRNNLTRTQRSLVFSFFSSSSLQPHSVRQVKYDQVQVLSFLFRRLILSRWCRESNLVFFTLTSALSALLENVASTIEDGIKVSFVFSSLFRRFIHTSKSKKIYLCIRPKFRFTQHI